MSPGEPIQPRHRLARDEPEVLCDQIQQVHAATFGVYGARKIWRQLGREGVVVARCTVERLMRQLGLQGAVRGKETRTTMPNPTTPCPAEVVNRQFRAPRPNVPWLSDFTPVATWQGFVYAVFVIDAFARCIAWLAGLQDGSCSPRPRCPGAGPP